MKDKVYPSKEVTPFNDSFEWAYLNVDKAATRKVMKSFAIRGVPYIAIISPQGEILESSTGLIKTPQMVSMIESSLQKHQLTSPPKRSGIFKTKPNQ